MARGATDDVFNSEIRMTEETRKENKLHNQINQLRIVLILYLYSPIVMTAKEQRSIEKK